MNLQFIKYFVVLAETKNFTKAAEKVFVVQSTFSSGIKKLEEYLDCKLFVRDKRNVELTSEGKVLLEKAKQLLALWGEIEGEFKDTESKEIKIGILATIHHTDFVIPILKSFQELYPNYQIKLVEGNEQELVDLIHKNELDVIFSEQEFTEKSDLESRFLYEEKLELVVSKNHPLANKEKIEIEAIDAQPFIKHESCMLSQEIYAEFSKRKIEPIPVFSAQHSEVLLGLISSGIGISLMAKPKQYPEDVRFIPLSNIEFKRGIVLAWNSENKSQRLQKFLTI
ncbi:LysR family transcriptional regulator [Aureivirga sp. CE67]|uniref:LysR family transcriptional regulator n=1 Tax=Aureivirga sp. CE67 TaxID=1788983 RepID=UPI0018CA352C|nr:LysR family transcriptional regulator [Aureivirga sp. CE67]